MIRKGESKKNAKIISDIKAQRELDQNDSKGRIKKKNAKINSDIKAQRELDQNDS